MSTGGLGQVITNWLESLTCSQADTAGQGVRSVCTTSDQSSAGSKLAPVVKQVNDDREPKCRGMTATQYLLYRSSYMSEEGEEAVAEIRM